MCPRKWQPREQRLVVEYIIAKYPGAIHMTRVRLGELDQPRYQGRFAPDELRALGVWRRWADAVVVTSSELILIEAAIRPDPGYASKLEVYAELAMKTPELEPYLHLPLRLELVYAIEDPVVISVCERRNIRCVPFAPKWILEYLEELYPRERRPPQERGFLPPGETEE